MYIQTRCNTEKYVKILFLFIWLIFKTVFKNDCIDHTDYQIKSNFI